MYIDDRSIKSHCRMTALELDVQISAIADKRGREYSHYTGMIAAIFDMGGRVKRTETGRHMVSFYGCPFFTADN